MKRLLVLAALSFVVAGCSAAVNHSETQFRSTEELAKVVDSVEGWSCPTSRYDDEQHTRDNLDKYGVAGLPCSGGSISIYGSDAKRSALAAESYNALAAGECRLDGRNWSVWGQQYAVELVKKAMGGTLTCG